MTKDCTKQRRCEGCGSTDYPYHEPDCMLGVLAEWDDTWIKEQGEVSKEG